MNLEWTTTVPGDDGEDVEVTVTATISGRHRRATRLDPEEFPEVEIESVKDELGVDLMDTLSPQTLSELENEGDVEAADEEADARYEYEEDDKKEDDYD